jgi:hypothetical protein
MAKSLRFLLQTYAQPGLEARKSILAVTEEFGCAPPYTQEQDGPPFDAPEGKRMPRVYALDLPDTLSEGEESLLEQRLRQTGVVQYIVAL